jgi:hypothetical protein
LNSFETIVLGADQLGVVDTLSGITHPVAAIPQNFGIESNTPFWKQNLAVHQPCVESVSPILANMPLELEATNPHLWSFQV